MRRSDLAVGEILDDAGRLVSAIALPWAGVLWLTSVPLRLAQAHFAARVRELGSEAHSYGDHLQGLAVVVALTLLVSLWGRAVFARACVLHLRTLEPGGLSPLRLRPGPFVTYVYVALVVEVVFYATCASGVALPALVLVAGLAAATMPLIERPGLLRPFGLLAANARQVSPLLGLLLAFGAAFVLAGANLFLVFHLGLWLADGVVGLDLTRWGGLLGLENRRFVYVLLAGAWLLIEPWWLAALVVYVHRLRARASGEDLRLWFGRLRKANVVRPLVIAVLLWGGLAGPAASSQEEALATAPLSLDDYAAALDGLRSGLEEGRLEAARSGARVLSGREVLWAGDRLTPDPTVLAAVQEVETPAEARQEAARIRRLLVALGEGPGTTPVTARPEVLSRIGPGPDIEKGGETPRLRVKPLTFPERVEAALLAVVDWMSDAMRRLGDWLRRLVPQRVRPEPEDAGTTATVAVAFAAVIAALLVVLALRTLRREAVDLVETRSSPAAPTARDEDPLSREASGWEGYARELAAKRRWREAIRAWYHAVLVTLFRSGLLHHQRGRTNWEYVSQLAPDLGWRRGFVALTRQFDREWYGRRTSDHEALSECAREAQEVLRAVQGTGEGA